MDLYLQNLGMVRLPEKSVSEARKQQNFGRCRRSLYLKSLHTDEDALRSYSMRKKEELDEKYFNTPAGKKGRKSVVVQEEDKFYIRRYHFQVHAFERNRTGGVSLRRSVPAKEAEDTWEKILNHEKVEYMPMPTNSLVVLAKKLGVNMQVHRRSFMFLQQFSKATKDENSKSEFIQELVRRDSHMAGLEESDRLLQLEIERLRQDLYQKDARIAVLKSKDLNIRRNGSRVRAEAKLKSQMKVATMTNRIETLESSVALQNP